MYTSLYISYCANLKLHPFTFKHKLKHLIDLLDIFNMFHIINCMYNRSQQKHAMGLSMWYTPMRATIYWKKFIR